MKDFSGRIAVITGGGTGMGRELARQLSAEGCNVAMCDVSEENMAETKRLCDEEAPQGTRVTAHKADVSEERDVGAFRDAVAAEHDTDRVHLLFNNAGIGGGGSFVSDPREPWEKTFNVCWGGVYHNCRAFMPMLVAADEAHIVNTSSVNGFWATIGPDRPHTAYSAAKFAVKGFSEALITDLRMNAPHVKVSVVMPGHIGTDIVENSMKVLGADADPEAAKLAQEMSDLFRENAPTTAAEAATIMLDAVRSERWRVLVGADAEHLDKEVRKSPEEAYELSFYQRLAETGPSVLRDIPSGEDAA